MSTPIVNPGVFVYQTAHKGPCIGGPMCGRELQSMVRTAFVLWNDLQPVMPFSNRPEYILPPDIKVRHAQYLFSDGIWFHARNI